MNNSTLSLFEFIISGNTDNSGSFMDTLLFGDITVGNLLAVFLIVILTFIIAKLVASTMKKFMMGKLEMNNIAFITKLVRWIIYFIGFMALSPQLHLDLSGLLVTGGIVAVAVGFASQNTLSNFVAGILLMFERPVAIGDNILVNEIEGYVQDIGLLSTTIRTYKGVFVRIPNESMFTSDITNYVSNIARRFDYTIGISYNDDIKKAISIIKDTVEKHPYVLENPAPFLYVDELADSSINITVRMWSPSGYWWDAKTELLWKIYDALTEGGVEIPFNQMVLWFGENDAEKLKEASLNKKQSGSGVAQILGESYSAPENAIKEEK